MFTGIITDLGMVKTVTRARLVIVAPATAKELRAGDSVSVNGVCLTAARVARKNDDSFTVDILDETLKRTNLGKLRIGEVVNLELALKMGDRMGGHIVTGHVDCAGRLFKKYKKVNDTVLEVMVDEPVSKKIFLKGSVTVNGVSLTVSGVRGRRFAVNIIPHTLKHTNLGFLNVGQPVNIETDKYLRQHHS